MLKRAALAAIHWYWKVIREEDRQVCLYRVSCSRHVHAQIEGQGLRVGLRAFNRRMRSCKQGYTVEREGGRLSIRTVNGFWIPEEELNPVLRKELSAGQRLSRDGDAGVLR